MNRLAFAFLLAFLALHCSGPTVPLDEAVRPLPAYEITLDIVNSERIHGWAWDANDPDRAVKLLIYDGNDMIAAIVADDLRKDLVDAGKGNGKHAFDLPFPDELCDGREHLIHAQVTGEPPILWMLPRSVVCAPDGLGEGAKN